MDASIMSSAKLDSKNGFDLELPPLSVSFSVLLPHIQVLAFSELISLHFNTLFNFLEAFSWSGNKEFCIISRAVKVQYVQINTAVLCSLNKDSKISVGNVL